MPSDGQRIAKIALLPHEVEQLGALDDGPTWAGDLISKDDARALKDKGFAAQDEGHWWATLDGQRWLKQAGLLAYTKADDE